MFTNTYLPHVGGVARSVQFFAEDLIDLGHRVLVVAPTFSDDTKTSNKQPEVLRVPAIQQFNGSDFSVRIPLPLYVDQEIEKFVPDMDLFVFSSKSETQGMVLLEAMAAGKPVVAVDASGSREVIRDGENGRLLPGDASTENFAEATREFRPKPGLARDWSSGARQTAQRFSREACAAKMEELYRSLFFQNGFFSDFRIRVCQLGKKQVSKLHFKSPFLISPRRRDARNPLSAGCVTAWGNIVSIFDLRTISMHHSNCEPAIIINKRFAI